MRALSLSISPCPNDTFMFDALINSKIDLRGYKFDCVFEDIDTLNKNIKESRSDISKISYAAYPAISEQYNILSSGSALGRGNAPLLVSRKKIYPDEVAHCKIAIPGYDTTAALLLKFAFGEVKELKQYLFSDIAEAILSDEVDAGVLIHEERFVYKEKSLRLVADLSDCWNEKTNLPIPLGAIVVNKSLDIKIQQDINSLLRESIEFAFDNMQSSWQFVKQHARYMEDDVIEQHINMFVNKFSLEIGDEGERAVLTLLKTTAVQREFDKSIFIK